ncbi:MAG: hypothetical protein ABJH75_17215, partial [Roseibium sp.]|uniref:hypothetical protein n=1 Tax=Roseibium sp. TaxID=1936156 RepID=UPI00329A4AB3
MGDYRVASTMPSTPFDWQRSAFSYTNTGSSDLFVIEMDSTTNNSAGPYKYKIDLNVSGGNGDAGPPCDELKDSEFYGPNGALRHECPCKSEKRDPIDARTGNLHMPMPGLSVPGRGPGL